MNCWEILGINPTRDQAAIDQAYEQQKKFAPDDDLAKLELAYDQASGKGSDEERQPGIETELTAEEQQIVREVVIQIKALLNDSRRAADEGIWKAILTEPPADQLNLRAAVATALEPQVHPMADNGSFPLPVVAFLGDWFGWTELQEKTQQPAVQDDSESSQQLQNPREHQAAQEDEDTQPPMTSFWPAVIGWVVALGVLVVFFDGIFGG